VGHHDAFDWFTLGAAYLGVLGLAGGVFRYGSQVRDKRQAQAQHIFAWFEPAVGKGRYVVRNRSDWPLSEVKIDVTVNGGHVDFIVGLIDCGDGHHEEWVGHNLQGARWVPATCWFTDAAGRRWFRSTTGELRRWRPWHMTPAQQEGYTDQQRRTPAEWLLMLRYVRRRLRRRRGIASRS
jgi:hypothetical protein